ncbi:unnamed protein product [Ascophyllum nodosum]
MSLLQVQVSFPTHPPSHIIRRLKTLITRPPHAAPLLHRPTSIYLPFDCTLSTSSSDKVIFLTRQHRVQIDTLGNITRLPSGKMALLKVFSVLATMLLGHLNLAFAQDSDTGVSCVQVSSSKFSTPCPCGLTSSSFSVVGETSVAKLRVNLAVVLDGSDSVGSANFLVQREFAKNIIAAFAERNLFANGGTASYVQYSSFVDASDTGTFFSLKDFNNFVDNNQFNGGGTDDIDGGITAARYLLNAAPPASVAIMIVLTVGINIIIGTAADDSRADGITLYALGIGVSVSVGVLLPIAGNIGSVLGAVLLAIAGSEDNVFSVDDFEGLQAVVSVILGVVGTSTVACPATNAVLIVEYGATVDSVVSDPDATLSNNIVAFFVSDLEDNPTTFTVILDTCGATEPVDPVVSITYSDNQGNSPDFTELLDITSDSTCPPATSPPTPLESLGAPFEPCMCGRLGIARGRN